MTGCTCETDEDACPLHLGDPCPSCTRRSGHDDDCNPFIGGANVPDAGGYNVFAVMDDGGTLCYRCVIDPTNPVHDERNHGDRVVWHGDGWGVIAFEADGNVDGPEYCDHCNAVIVPDYNEED